MSLLATLVTPALSLLPSPCHGYADKAELPCYSAEAVGLIWALQTRFSWHASLGTLPCAADIYIYVLEPLN
jgi:hypothetical protein